MARNRILGLFTLILVLVLTFVAIDYQRTHVIVAGYDPKGICQGLLNPECGYCPGKVYFGKCIATKESGYTPAFCQHDLCTRIDD
jgi:hypothetical protein